MGALADVLAPPPADPLTTEVVSVHSRGIERWIAQELSSSLGAGSTGDDGVCAGVSFPFPARLVRGAVADGSGIDPDNDPWLPERLTWPLLELVEAHPGEEMLGPLRAHLGGTEASPDPERADRRFGAVRHIADLFDRYGVHRPEMVRRWRDGRDVGPEGGTLAPRHAWQPRLWRAVREQVGIESFAERHEIAVGALTTDPDLVDLPARLALFGVTALPATYLSVLAALAEHRAVHLLLLHPSPALWTRVAEVAGTHGQRLWTREEDPSRTEARNPLLASWGRDARELQLVAPVPEDAAHRHHHRREQAPATTLLGRIQADVRADRPPGASAGTGDLPAHDPTDTSLQLHDCHGRLRQVEVLRDAILHLLAADPTLEPRDIIVMCPDIESFAPLVTAVFGAEAVTDDGLHAPAGPPALRVRLADRSIRRTNPVLEVVAQLLDLADGRMTASSVLDLLSRDPVRRRFHLDDDDIEQLTSWVTDLQIRWGLDGPHRRRHGLPDLDANTWRAGLERLQLGIAMADEDLRLVGGVAPYDGVEGHSSDLAGRLVELVARLGRAVEAMATPQPVDAWRDVVAAAADTLTATRPGETWQQLQLHRVLDDLVAEATLQGTTSDVALELGEVRRLLDDRLEGRPSRTGHRTGDLTICTLVPMRSVPHRVVCLLGLDDGAFPRQAVPDSDDLLQARPRVGDRDPRSEDRQLLLDALLAATETVVITYAGRDERTNEARPPAVPVDELLDVVDRTVRTADGRPREVVTTRHPLQQHDPRSYEPGRLRPDGAPWSFDGDGLAAARAAVGDTAPPPSFLDGELPPPDDDTLVLDDLVDFLRHPVRAFMRQRLDVSLPTRDEEPADAIPATLRGLDAWRVGDAMVSSWRRGDDLERTLAVLRARGLLPPRDLAEDDLDRVRRRVERITGLCEQLDIEPAPVRRSVDLDVELPDGRRLTGTIADISGWQLQTIGYSRVGAKHRLATWARLVAATAADPDHPWEGVTVGRHPWKQGDVAQAMVLAPLADTADGRRAAATTNLMRLVDLYDRGRRAPLPLYCETSRKIAEGRRRYEDPRRYVHYEWETNPYRGFENEDRDPYHLLALGAQLSTDELFARPCRDAEERGWADDDRRVVAYAWRLWEPILAAERSREG